MDLEGVGASGVSGVFGVILAFFGFKQRVDSLEKRHDAMSESVIYRDVHTECSRAWHDSLDRLEKKVDRILEKI